MRFLAVASNARRAKQTLERALEAFPAHVTHVIENTIYLASADHLIDVLRQTPDRAQTLLAVGHNPGFAELERQSLALRTKIANEPLAIEDQDAQKEQSQRYDQLLKTSVAQELILHDMAVQRVSADGKTKTTLQIAAIVALLLQPVGALHTLAMALLAAAVAVTVITGADYFVHAARVERVKV